ncbi:MAG: diguanylate cyclase [Nitrospira sp.]|nr:diguanylate cyclase [Nitrospira sp.]
MKKRSKFGRKNEKKEVGVRTPKNSKPLDTQHKWAEEALAELAIRDPLTDLYNRRYLDYRMKEEMARADRNQQPLAILLCDLDHFKAINDTLGHQAGDEMLKAVARRIQDSTRGTDLVFRWGGDEILIVLGETTHEGLLIAAGRIRKGVHKIAEKSHLDLDISIGIALYPEHGRTVDELIRTADLALYIAKQGGDKVHIGDGQHYLDEHSIKVVFQPIVDVHSNQVIGHEALSRDPKGDLNIQDLFKRYRAIGKLNELKQVCFKLQLKRAQAVGLQKVFINVDFNLLTQLDSIPKPPGMEVILEISELEALQNIENPLKIARKWREMGYKFAIDDFGAGFISLPFIAQLVPEYIKVDRSTILHALASEMFREFLKDIVLSLKKYTTEGFIAEGIEAVAEGVETEKELQVVREMGIHLAQGFSLGKPEEL